MGSAAGRIGASAPADYYFALGHHNSNSSINSCNSNNSISIRNHDGIKRPGSHPKNSSDGNGSVSIISSNSIIIKRAKHPEDGDDSVGGIGTRPSEEKESKKIFDPGRKESVDRERGESGAGEEEEGVGSRDA